MKFLNALNLIYGLGPQKLHQLMECFGSAEKIWHANESKLRSAGMNEKLMQVIIEARPSINPDLEIEKLKKEDINTISFIDAKYPTLLKEIHNPPFLLYARGNLKALEVPMISIVGSHKLTPYGERVAFGIARDLASAGICVVSGLAFGIDAQAHKGALTGKGLTIAVLGGSIDDKSIMPRSNFTLAQDILNNDGLLLSEFPVPTAPDRGTFPARNRIMAGLTRGTVVIEAAMKSGSLITARHAIENNRDVFAIPGNIFSQQSEGCHHLIKQGAKLTTSAQDVLEELRIGTQNTRSVSIQESLPLNLNDEEKILLSVLSHEPLHIDTIKELTKLETSATSCTLALLEMKTLIKNTGGHNYIKL